VCPLLLISVLLFVYLCACSPWPPHLPSFVLAPSCKVMAVFISPSTFAHLHLHLPALICVCSCSCWCHCCLPAFICTLPPLLLLPLLLPILPPVAPDPAPVVASAAAVIVVGGGGGAAAVAAPAPAATAACRHRFLPPSIRHSLFVAVRHLCQPASSCSWALPVLPSPVCVCISIHMRIILLTFKNKDH
jgi:hypothetical protein